MRDSDHIAVDLGATSGRVVVGRREADGVRLREVHRFANRHVELPSGIHWNIGELYEQTLEGIRRSGAAPRSIAVDSWGVDYGLLDASGRLLGLPSHYRDARTRGLRARFDSAAIFARTGVAAQDINTLAQLASEHPDGALHVADCMLLIPDLMGFFLTGVRGAERTIASTTQLLDTHGEWAPELLRGIAPAAILPGLRDAGEVVGSVTASAAAAAGVERGVLVTTVGAHDTASALVAVPATSEDFAYVSCGTWAIVGVERHRPEVGDAARTAGFTNERGVGGTTRFQRNGTGLWLLSECLRSWRSEGRHVDLDALLDEAARLRPRATVLDPDADEFTAPGGMPARIVAHCRRHDLREPRSMAEMVRCIVDSLADAFARTIATIGKITGRCPTTVHIVGGGAKNRLLCQATADATGLPTVAGPVEATALGNILVQLGSDDGVDVWRLREEARRSSTLHVYAPEYAGGVRSAR